RPIHIPSHSVIQHVNSQQYIHFLLPLFLPLCAYESSKSDVSARKSPNRAEFGLLILAAMLEVLSRLPGLLLNGTVIIKHLCRGKRSHERVVLNCGRFCPEPARKGVYDL